MEERRGFGQRRGGFRGRGERGGFVPKPVEVGKEYDVEIQEVSRRGEGIARIQGLVIFVPNAKQGEHAKIKITRISRRFAEAEVVGKGEATSEEKEEKEE
jgi:predicted RNA-binding protein with TRAM domain